MGLENPTPKSAETQIFLLHGVLSQFSIILVRRLRYINRPETYFGSLGTG